MSHQGTVKLFNKDRGFGFITAADGSEIFCHLAGLADNQYLVPGDVVRFEVEESKIKPGQMQAIQIQGGSGGATRGEDGSRPAQTQQWGGGQQWQTPAPAQPTGTIQGNCKSYSEKKGFGFIMGDGTNDIFFYVKDIADGKCPVPGDTLIFDAEESAKEPGKVIAKNVSGGSGNAITNTAWQPLKGKDGGKGKGKDDWSGGWGGDGGWGKAASKGGGWSSGPYGGGGYSDDDAPLTSREQQMLGMMIGMAMSIRQKNADNGGKGGGANDPMNMLMSMMGSSGSSQITDRKSVV